MATIESPPNSVWPNGLQTDSEGYVNFYPLGTNKIDISTITWPEGTEVKAPFVYQDDKLVGFIDTKALDIDNNNTTIDINYTHFDADLDSIMENTLTINAPANAVVNVKYGAVDKVLTEKIEKLIGKGKCEVKFDKDNNKANIVFALDITQAQIAEVGFSLIHVLPSNLITDVEWTTEWADGLPTTYTRLEYLEAVTSGHDIKVEVPVIDSHTGLYAKWSQSAPADRMTISRGWGDWRIYPPTWKGADFVFIGGSNLANRVVYLPTGFIANKVYTGSMNLFDDGTHYLDGVAIAIINNPIAKYPIRDIHIFSYHLDNTNLSRDYGFVGRIYEAKITQANTLINHFIPTLDSTGTPCMFDLVSRQPFYNSGTGDFLYPTDAAPAMSAGLDEKFYAKLTEHGIRRLYHVPTGCTMTKDEYAAANGFKELVEPPMPLEGYWMPVWRETEIQLICDWVETEPPTEEI